ncbi:8720_t:CDS:1 [Scutellospora calospora]|uniref:8720_t:CDS:1 n=1 Tax=Scutellospora calospora TaxID=85575 RepID=A0ACA9MN37_9GLOM|nr:8720_t:CDS:1 [Scutellospora calospora]
MSEENLENLRKQYEQTQRELEQIQNRTNTTYNRVICSVEHMVERNLTESEKRFVIQRMDRDTEIAMNIPNITFTEQVAMHRKFMKDMILRFMPDCNKCNEKLERFPSTF